MRTARRWVGLLLTLALALTVAACTRPMDPEVGDARVLNIGDTLEPEGLDMITVSGAGTAYVLLYNVYETLVKLDADGKDEVGQLMTAMQSMIGKLTQIIGEVRTAADHLTNAASQVSATAQSLAQSSSEQDRKSVV